MVSVTLSYSVMGTGVNGKCYLIIYSVMDTRENGKCYLIIDSVKQPGYSRENSGPQLFNILHQKSDISPIESNLTTTHKHERLKNKSQML